MILFHRFSQDRRFRYGQSLAVQCNFRLLFQSLPNVIHIVPCITVNEKFAAVYGNRRKPQNLPQVVIVRQGQGFNGFIGDCIQVIGYAVLHIAARLYKGEDGIHAIFCQWRVNSDSGVIGIIRLHVGFIACAHRQPHKHCCKGNRQQDCHNSHCAPGRLNTPADLPQEKQVFFSIFPVRAPFRELVQQDWDLPVQLINTYKNQQTGTATVQQCFIGLNMKSFFQQNHTNNHSGDGEQTGQDTSMQRLKTDFLVFLIIIKQINHFLSPDDLCGAKHSESIHQDEEKQGHSPRA